MRFPPSGVNGHHPYCPFTRVITAGFLARRLSGIEGVKLHTCVASPKIGSSEDQEQNTEEPHRRSAVSIPDVKNEQARD
jgi:hypothetical protein